MNSVVFLEWYENQWMAALKNPSLIMLDNASYHNVKTTVVLNASCPCKLAILSVL
jgi:transposase